MQRVDSWRYIHYGNSNGASVRLRGLRHADHVMRMLFSVGFNSPGCMCLCEQFVSEGLIYLSGRYPVDLCF